MGRKGFSPPSAQSARLGGAGDLDKPVRSCEPLGRRPP